MLAGSAVELGAQGAPTGHSSSASVRRILGGSPVMPAQAAPANLNSELMRRSIVLPIVFYLVLGISSRLMLTLRRPFGEATDHAPSRRSASASSCKMRVRLPILTSRSRPSFGSL
jgi:hypothetical protein